MWSRKFWFDHRGRFSRKQYWIATTAYLLGALILAGAALALAYVTPEGEATLASISIFAVIVASILIWSGVVTSAKRLHDRNKSGHWLWFYLLTPSAANYFADHFDGANVTSTSLKVVGYAIGLWMMIDLGILPGADDGNAYGPPL